MTGVLNALCAPHVVPQLSDSDVSENVPGSSSASISVNRDGTVTFTGDDSSADFDWAVPKWAIVGDAFYVQLDVTGDAPSPSAGTGSPLALTSNRSWTWASASGTRDATCTLTIFAGDQATVLAQATITVQIDATV